MAAAEYYCLEQILLFIQRLLIISVVYKWETYFVFFKAMFCEAIHIDRFERIITFKVVATLKMP